MAVIENFSDLERNTYWDVEGMSGEELERSYQTLNQRMSTIYRFVSRFNEYSNMRHDYSTEGNLTMQEVHCLTDICDNENMTVTKLSAAWGRSMSATSQTVRRLMRMGLVTRENAPENGKVFYLYPTEKGRRISRAHKRYDVEDTIKTVKTLLKDVSFQELESMLRVLEKYTGIFSKE